VIQPPAEACAASLKNLRGWREAQGEKGRFLAPAELKAPPASWVGIPFIIGNLALQGGEEVGFLSEETMTKLRTSKRPRIGKRRGLWNLIQRYQLHSTSRFL